MAAWHRLAAFTGLSCLPSSFSVRRAASRLRGIFRSCITCLPVRIRPPACCRTHPLTWWAVRRVSSYSGRVNLWLAGGVGVLYAAYLAAGDQWPAWLGRNVFEIFDRAGGAATLTTALVVLAAVPAAFQYGLWDSNQQGSLSKLELLLLTSLGRDYWRASAAAAWNRGRGYFLVALVLWTAQVYAHPELLLPSLAGLATGVVLWAFFSPLGFASFTRGNSGGGLGVLLTVGLPVLAAVLQTRVSPGWRALLPPGGVYCAQAGADPFLDHRRRVAALSALTVGRRAVENCQVNLAAWYEKHHGRMVLE